MSKSYAYSTTVSAAWMKRNGYLLDQVELMAKRPHGFAITDLPDVGETLLTRVCSILMSKGIIYKRKTGHRTVRYIHKDASLQDTKPQEVVRVATPSKLDPNAPMIITEKTKFTLCPSPPAEQTWHKSQFSNW